MDKNRQDIFLPDAKLDLDQLAGKTPGLERMADAKLEDMGLISGRAVTPVPEETLSVDQETHSTGESEPTRVETGAVPAALTSVAAGLAQDDQDQNEILNGRTQGDPNVCDQDRGPTKFATETPIVFGKTGTADVSRMLAPDGTPINKLYYKWRNGGVSTCSRLANAPCPRGVIEAFGAVDTRDETGAERQTDFHIGRREPEVARFRGLNTGKITNRIGVTFAIQASNCPRATFTNFITDSKLRVWAPGQARVALDLRGSRIDGLTLHDQDAAWYPRYWKVCSMRIDERRVADIVSVFFDNPAWFTDASERAVAGGGFEAPQMGPAIIKNGVMNDGTRFRDRTAVVDGTVLNEEVWFVTAVWSDANLDGRPPGIRGGSTDLVALVSWGYKIKVRFGASRDDNRGAIQMHPTEIFCHPADASAWPEQWRFAWELITDSYDEATGRPKRDGGNPRVYAQDLIDQWVETNPD